MGVSKAQVRGIKRVGKREKLIATWSTKEAGDANWDTLDVSLRIVCSVIFDAGIHAIITLETASW